MFHSTNSNEFVQNAKDVKVRYENMKNKKCIINNYFGSC